MSFLHSVIHNDMIPACKILFPLFSDLQRGSGLTLNRTLTFVPAVSVRCFSFLTVDDNIGLEETEFLTFTLEPVALTSDHRFTLGQYNRTSVGILDDDGM